jgi:hypothetical protein
MMIGRQSRSIAGVGTSMAALLILALSAPAFAQDQPAPRSIQVEISAAEGAGRTTGLDGMAVLTETEGGTGVQVLVPDAPEGTVATIQAGTCAAVGPDLVGLLGQLGTGGQAQATVPLPISTLADGRHVVALHPGLTLTTTLACGAIPAVVATDGQPPVGGECAGVPEWVARTQERLDRLEVLRKAQDAVSVDIAKYIDTLASNMGEVQAMVDQMRVEDVPAAAATVHQQMIATLQLAVDAAQLFLDALVGGGDVADYQEAIAKSTQVSEDMIKVRASVAGLKAKCPG